MRVTYRDYSYIHRNGPRQCILCWKMKLWKPTFSGRTQHFGNNVNFQDDSLSAVTKVMVYDVPVDMSNERLKDFFSKYGDVIQVDHEKHKVNGRMTSWNTGNAIISMSSVKVHIPPHMTGPHRGQNVSISTWYHGQYRFVAPNAATKIEICIKCRLTSHVTENCPQKRKVCYSCKQPGHMNADCPNSQKSAKVFVIENYDVSCFLGENCVFSNLNTECPVEIDGISHKCSEQCIQCAKASMFGDDESVDEIMKTDNPHEIRNLGKTYLASTIGNGDKTLCHSWENVWDKNLWISQGLKESCYAQVTKS